MTALFWIGVVGAVAALVGGGIILATRESRGYYSESPWWAWFILWAALIPALIGFLVFGVSKGDEIGCRNSARIAGLEYHWSLSAGCFYKFHGHWIPEERWRYITEGE